MVNPLARKSMTNYLKEDDIRVCHPDQRGGILNLDNKEHELIQNIIQGSKKACNKTNKVTLDELALRIKEGH